MKINNKIGGVAQKITSTVFFLVTFIFLLYLYGTLKYLPFFLVAMVVILPVAVNFFLNLFACKFNAEMPQKAVFDEETKKIKKVLFSIAYFFKRVGYACKTLYNKIHKVLQLVFVALAFVGVQILFGFMMPKFTSSPNYQGLSFLQPIIFAILFVGAIIVDKWIKHSEAENERTNAFFHNMRVSFYLTKLSLLLLIFVTTIKLLDFYDLQKYLYYAIIGIFYYASVFILISIVVSLLKKEIVKKPKLIVLLPFAGKDKNDLSVLSFLENNTGITMRGLWSMKLIKQIVPYTIISVAALFWLSTGIVQIEANQEAVVYRLGVLQEETLKPGLHFTLPAPFDKIEYYNTENINKVVIGYESKVESDNLWTMSHGSNEHKLLLGNGNELVSINLRIEYKIRDLTTYVSVSKSPDSMISAHAYNLITERVIQTDLKTLLAVDRDAFASTFKKDLDAVLDENDVGVEVVRVSMESIHPPLDIAEYYQKVISAEIQAEEIVRRAQTAATVTKTSADAEYKAIINSVTAEKNTAIANATSSVSEFMASVAANESNSESYHYYKYLDALTKAYGQNNLILVGDGVDSSKIYFGNFVGNNISNPGTTNDTEVVY